MGLTTARYDRTQILEQAANARSRRQRRRAIALYRWVLAVERNSIEIHERLAPLLAETGQDFDAWNCYRVIAHAALREGREDRAIAVYREATRALPREIQAWQGLARLLVRQSQDEEAVEALLEGSRQFRAHWNRPQSIHLLRRARAIDPWHFGTVIELARHLGSADQATEANMLLERLAERCDALRLRRVRAAQLAVSPGPRTLWAWLSTWMRRTEPEPEEDPSAGAEVVPLLTLAPPAEVAARAARDDADGDGDGDAAEFPMRRSTDVVPTARLHATRLGEPRK